MNEALSPNFEPITPKTEPIQLGQEIVVVVGPEGSGKSAIGRRLAATTGKPYIYTGDILRNLAATDNGPWGNACRAMFEQHKYLEPELLLEILTDRIGQEDTEDGFVLDGGLRTQEESVGFLPMLEGVNRLMPISVVHLRTPAWMTYPRLLKRGRDDDTEEGILPRFKNFYTNLGARTTFLRKQPGFDFFQINAMNGLDEIFAETCEALQSRNSQVVSETS